MAGQYIEPMQANLGDEAPVPSGRWRLPRPCVLCAQWSPQGMCRECQLRFLPAGMARCPRCALPQASGALCGACLRQPPLFSRCITLADYGFPWDRLIARLKFQQQPELAGLLAPLLARAIGQQGGPGRAQWVLPVPLGPARLAERGCNQAWELARRLGPALGLPARAQWLQRLRDTPHQVGLSRSARLRNLADVMWVPPEAARCLVGCHIALVDDVLTTGVTAAAVAQALLAAGAADVQVWVLARTLAPET